ncbi:ATP-binding cassette subfamily B protein [Xanthomonas arboricola]|uniref:ABC transporter ATP-binding protein n=1 Tax=Xanthomonas sp. 3793 TaxID=3035312 RepID=UPI0021686A01|nr:ABC transporter ATP-binding protein [Xanthomonas sp. 3793]MCS3746757.1 ATP-binding cassette subfamily B protein [Xanthomonas sp. 3793]
MAHDSGQIQSPYWRIATDASALDLGAILMRLAGAIRPVVVMARQAAPKAMHLLVASQLVSAAAAVWGLLLLKQVLTVLLPGVAATDWGAQLLPIGALLLLAHLMKVGAHAVGLSAQAQLVPKVRHLADDQILAASLSIDLVAFDDPHFFDRMQRARDRGALHIERVTVCLAEALSALLSVVAASLALLWLHPLLLFAMLMAFIPEGWAALAAARLHYSGMDRTIALTRHARMISELATSRDAAAEIRACQAQEYVLDQHRRSAIPLQEHLTTQSTLEARTLLRGRLLSLLGLLLTFGCLAAMLHAGWLNLALAGTAIVAIQVTTSAFAQCLRMLHEISERALYVDDYHDFLELAKAQRTMGGNMLPTLQPHEIVLEDVGFHYPGMMGRVALKDISLSIQAGQTVALVGENGSGKTTLAKLISGLYKPTNGTIRWDDCDLHQLQTEALRDRISIVLQHPLRWPGTVRDNIRLGQPTRHDPMDEALHQAAVRAQAIDVIEGLPDGWGCLLSREFIGGHDLSSGQWQRLAVARGIFRDAPLVIWDEPTAPLDAKAEHAVFQSLRELGRGRTVVLITHRLASVREADRIFFLKGGRLVEQGTHTELMQYGCAYAELYRLQARNNGTSG